MNASQTASIALVASGVTEFILRRGTTAKSLKSTIADAGTTPLIFGCYAVILILLFLPNLPGNVLPASARWVGVWVAFAGLGIPSRR
jgi:hypothetical protein